MPPNGKDPGEYCRLHESLLQSMEEKILKEICRLRERVDDVGGDVVGIKETLDGKGDTPGMKTRMALIEQTIKTVSKGWGSALYLVFGSVVGAVVATVAGRL